MQLEYHSFTLYFFLLKISLLFWNTSWKRELISFPVLSTENGTRDTPAAPNLSRKDMDNTHTQRFKIQILKDFSRRLFYTFNPWNSIKTRITSVSQLMSTRETRCRDVSKECKIKELMQNLILCVWKEKEADAERRQRGLHHGHTEKDLRLMSHMQSAFQGQGHRMVAWQLLFFLYTA